MQKVMRPRGPESSRYIPAAVIIKRSRAEVEKLEPKRLYHDVDLDSRCFLNLYFLDLAIDLDLDYNHIYHVFP